MKVDWRNRPYTNWLTQVGLAVLVIGLGLFAAMPVQANDLSFDLIRSEPQPFRSETSRPRFDASQFDDRGFAVWSPPAPEHITSTWLAANQVDASIQIWNVSRNVTSATTESSSQDLIGVRRASFVLEDVEVAAKDPPTPDGSQKQTETRETAVSSEQTLNSDSGRENVATDEEEGESEDETSFGEEPEEADARLFLRQSTVLLRPGQVQFEYGLLLDWRERTRPVVLPSSSTVVDGAQLEDQRRRNLFAIAPITFRLGVTDRVQAFASAPFGFAFSELATSQVDLFGDEFGLGDTRAGLNFQLRPGKRPCCGGEWIGTLAFTAPTGNQSIKNEFQSPGLGAGFWGISAGILSVQTYDPVVLFFGLGYRHLFEKNAFGGKLSPGDEYSWQFGLGFAVNQYVTLSTAATGSYVAETRFNDLGLPKSLRFPVRLRHAITLTCDQCFILEPSIVHGLTSDASDVTVGLTVTRAF